MLTKFRARNLCTRANFCNLITEAPLKLKICMIVVLSENNILTKFRANPMHVVHVVRARMCTQAILSSFFEFIGL